MTREELVGIYAKKIEAEYGEEFVTMLFAERIKFILAELIAAVQGSINRDAPTSTATSEVIEKYARDLRMHNETRPLANTREKQEETLRAILTRFASEITVDAGKVDVRNTAINILGKLGSLFQECTEYDQSGFDQEPEERFDSEKWQREGIKIIAAALSAAGGGK